MTSETSHLTGLNQSPSKQQCWLTVLWSLSRWSIWVSMPPWVFASKQLNCASGPMTATRLWLAELWILSQKLQKWKAHAPRSWIVRRWSWRACSIMAIRITKIWPNSVCWLSTNCVREIKNSETFASSSTSTLPQRLTRSLRGQSPSTRWSWSDSHGMPSLIFVRVSLRSSQLSPNA